MRTRADWYITAASIALLAAGVALSHRIEPGVRVEKVTLAGNTTALKFLPAAPGPNPIALLGHGAAASKETLFCYGEALAAAGFVCFSMDFPGHGESRRPFSIPDIVRTPKQIERELGTVEVYIGHSMGAGAGAQAVYDSGFRPRLFISVGANPDLGESGPPLLLLVGRFEEFVPLDTVRARTDARVVVSPWCDHVFEMLDPYLVNAAVKAACAAVGKTTPAPPTCWLWRLAGLVLGIAGALGLMFCLPELHPQLARVRGFLVPAILIIALILTMGTWFRWAPDLHRIPVQLALMVLIWLTLVVADKFRLPRWSVAAFAAVMALVSVIIAAYVRTHWKPGNWVFLFFLLAVIMVVTTGLLFEGTILGWIAARRGSRRDGDIAMAIFVGYALGQWILVPF